MRAIFAGFVLVAGSAAFAQDNKAALDPTVALAELGLSVSGAKWPALTDAYRADAVSLKEMREKPEQYPVRAAVLKAVPVLESARKVQFLTSLRNEPQRELQKRVQTLQEEVAKLLADLQDCQERFEGLPDKVLAMEKSQRWQAHALLAQAEVQLRLAHLQEYSHLLGDVRTDSLADLQGEQNGWKLVPSEKMRSKREARELALRSQELLGQVIVLHQKTPWAVQASEWKELKLGFLWQSAILPKD